MKKHYASVVFALSLSKEELKDFFGKLFIKGYKSNIEQIIESTQKDITESKKYEEVIYELPENIIEIKKMIDLVSQIDLLVPQQEEISTLAKQQITALTTDDVKLLVEVLKTSSEETRKNSELSKRLAYLSSEYKQHILVTGPSLAASIAAYDMSNHERTSAYQSEIENYETNQEALDLVLEENYDYARVSSICSKMIEKVKTSYPEQYENLEWRHNMDENQPISVKTKEKQN